jgi:aldehyde:ferredoxin oxidoreductase
MKNGGMGKILWVDLSHNKIREEPISESMYQQYLSGIGLAVRLLYDRIPSGADPLGPENILGFVSGQLTGTGALFAGRWMAVGKSPLTGTWGDANCGGNFSPAIKRCGYDGIFFSGISQKPVYLFIDKNGPSLRDAVNLWGLDTNETETLLKKKAGCANARVACIGQAGEKLSLISGIANDGGRMAARSGLGAVMGSKKLKALVLCDARRIQPHDRQAIKKLSQACNESVQFMPPFPPAFVLAYLGAFLRALPVQPNTEMMQFNLIYKTMLKKWGTASLNQILIELGDAPIKNWKGSNEDFGSDRSAHLNPEVFSDCVMVKYHCYACPLGCGGICSKPGKFESTHKPEYETVLALGGLCMNDDPDSIFYLNDKLNRAGMDTISTGGTVAYAIECFENGILSEQDTGGLKLTWGNSQAIMTLVDMMIARQGIGDVLADGVKKAAERIRQGTESYAIHAGGQELAMHDSRFDPGFAVHNCVEATPGRHTIGSQLYYELFQLWQHVESLPKPDMLYSKRSKYQPDRQKALASAACSKFMNLMNGAGTCLYGAMLGAESFPFFDWLNASTGWELTAEKYMQIGERIQVLKQLFNLKQGIDPRQIKMTDRALGRPPMTAGGNKGRQVPIETLRKDYWQTLGWDPQTGRPTKRTLERLGLSGIDDANLITAT